MLSPLPVSTVFSAANSARRRKQRAGSRVIAMFVSRLFSRWCYGEIYVYRQVQHSVHSTFICHCFFVLSERVTEHTQPDEVRMYSRNVVSMLQFSRRLILLFERRCQIQVSRESCLSGQ